MKHLFPLDLVPLILPIRSKVKLKGLSQPLVLSQTNEVDEGLGDILPEPSEGDEVAKSEGGRV